MDSNMNTQEFISYLKDCDNQTLVIDDENVIRKFKLIDKNRVFYKKIWSNDYVETIIDIEDALALFSLYK